MKHADALRQELDECREALPEVVTVEQYDELHRRIKYLKSCIAFVKPAPRYTDNVVDIHWTPAPNKQRNRTRSSWSREA
jgi:hypothetical protein